MSHTHASIIGLGLLTLLVSFSAQAQQTTTTTVVEKRVLLTPAPKGECTTVQGHWEGNIWKDTYTLCKYENRKEGTAWVSDYWACTASTADGSCTAWELVPGHWVSTLDQQ